MFVRVLTSILVISIIGISFNFSVALHIEDQIQQGQTVELSNDLVQQQIQNDLDHNCHASTHIVGLNSDVELKTPVFCNAFTSAYSEQMHSVSSAILLRPPRLI